MLKSRSILLQDGIFLAPGMFSADEIQQMNAAMDPVFAEREGLSRSYVHPDELESIGALKLIFKPAFRDFLLDIMPDPVLYHCHAYEISANCGESHIFADTFSGFHRDIFSDERTDGPTHVSVFIHLTDVNEGGGAFEIVAQEPTRFLTKRSPIISMVGPAGTTFAWNRRYYHRASPNRSSIRRRIFKLSVQHNRFVSEHLANEHFSRLRASLPEGQDVYMDLLLGRYQRKQPPLLRPSSRQLVETVPNSRSMNLPWIELVKENIRSSRRRLSALVRGREASYE